MQIVTPVEQPQKCDVVNANVLWVSKEVVDRIGILTTISLMVLPTLTILCRRLKEVSQYFWHLMYVAFVTMTMEKLVELYNTTKRENSLYEKSKGTCL